MILKIITAFSISPGPRRIREGENSAEKFRGEHLVPALQHCLGAGEILIVDLDGAAGYSCGFLEESFGGLIRLENFDLETLRSMIVFKCDEDPEIIKEINEYMTDAQEHENERH